jgi:hypothetical protein
MVKQSTAFIIEFNNTFPLDREYRKNHGIPLFSEQHRNINQIDVYLEWLENEVYEEHELVIAERKKKAELYKKGEWVVKKEDIEAEANIDELFDNLKF